MSNTASIANIKISDREQFYKNAKDYWETQPATVNGMLGGFEILSKSDCEHSLKVIETHQKTRQKPQENNTNIALDVGAGIGRITKNVLTKKYDHVDMLEFDQKNLTEAENYLGPEKDSRTTSFCVAMHDFKFQKKCDCIWIQWCIGHLTDVDALRFLSDCKNKLKSDGFVVVKDNVMSMYSYEETSVLDEEDSSVMRGKEDLICLI